MKTDLAIIGTYIRVHRVKDPDFPVLSGTIASNVRSQDGEPCVTVRVNRRMSAAKVWSDVSEYEEAFRVADLSFS